MSKYTMRIVIEFIVHLSDNYLGKLECDLRYLPYVFLLIYVIVITGSLLSITYK